MSKQDVFFIGFMAGVIVTATLTKLLILGQ